MKLTDFRVRIAKANANAWVIGKLESVQQIARALRSDERLRESLADEKIQVGRRIGDKPPKGDPPGGGFRGQIKGKAGVSAEKLEAQFAGERKGGGGQAFKPRLTDRFEEARGWYLAKSLEAHHLVETSIMDALGVGHGRLGKRSMDCVLVSAELHRRWYTAELAGSRHQFEEGMGFNAAEQKLIEIYDRLYDGAEMAPLKKCAYKIIEQVRAALLRQK